MEGLYRRFSASKRFDNSTLCCKYPHIRVVSLSLKEGTTTHAAPRGTHPIESNLPARGVSRQGGSYVRTDVPATPGVQRRGKRCRP